MKKYTFVNLCFSFDFTKHMVMFSIENGKDERIATFAYFLSNDQSIQSILTTDQYQEIRSKLQAMSNFL